MGSWISYHLTVGSGDRDLDTVAGDLRDGLREDVPELCNDPTDPTVWSEGSDASEAGLDRDAALADVLETRL